MRKTIKFNDSYMAPWMQKVYRNRLEKRYDLILTEEPDYIFVSYCQPMCVEKKLNNSFLLDYPDAKVRIYIQHEATSCDINLFDYGIMHTGEIIIEDRFFHSNLLTSGYGSLYGYDIYERLSKQKRHPKTILAEKDKFCNFLYSNAGAATERADFFHLLSKYKMVHSYGKYLNNVNPHEKNKEDSHFKDLQWFEESIVIKKPHKFSIAFENAFYPGSCSLKIQSSMLSETIPIYWGNPRIIEDFNRKAFINCHNFDSFDSVVNRIIEIDRNDELWCEIMNEPWMTQEQYRKHSNNESKLIEFLYHIFDQPLHSARRRPYGFWPDRYEEVLKKTIANHRYYEKHMLKPKLNTLKLNTLRKSYRAIRRKIETFLLS